LLTSALPPEETKGEARQAAIPASTLQQNVRDY